MKTRHGAEWAPSIYKSTTVTTARGSSADVVTVWSRTFDHKGKRQDSYDTYNSNGGIQVASTRKDGDHYHKRMCEIAKETLEKREKDAEDADEDM